MPSKIKKPIIAIDVDDVLSESAKEIVKFSNKNFGTSLAVEDYIEHWAKMWQVDYAETQRRFNEYIKSGILSRYDHISGAFSVLNKLKNKYKLIIITSRNLSLKDESMTWINKRFPGIFDEKDVYFAGIWDKRPLDDEMAHETKADICKKLNVDYLIDDQKKHCIGAAKLGVKTLIFGDYRWNKSDSLPVNVYKVLIGKKSRGFSMKSNKKPIIAVDIDNVLSEFAEVFIDYSNKNWGTSLSVDDYHEDWEKFWGIADREEINRRFLEFNQLGVGSTLNHKEYALDVLNILKNKYDLCIITFRRPMLKDSTLKWLEERFPNVFSNDSVYFAGLIDVCDNSKSYSKGELAKKLNVDYIIDDQISHCLSASSFGIKSLLYGNYSQNYNDELPKNIIRVSDWQDVQRFFDEEK